MSTIRDAILRIARSIRHVEAAAPPPPLIARPSAPSASSPPPPAPASPLHHTKVSNDEVNKYKQLATDRYRRKYYQSFLEPLEIPNLKTFEQDRAPYDAARATDNWRRKRANERQGALAITFFEERVVFLKLMDLLVELTPQSLRVDSSMPGRYWQRVALQEDPTRQWSPKYTFHELPKFPLASPAAADALVPSSELAFRKYIHHLTHLHCLYQNSSSLENGIIPDILLHTHRLTNAATKPFRLVHTYNYLIKFFGCDKNQSLFARELLLVMNKDGHRPNIDTINHLLRMCRTHLHIRLVTSTVSVMLKNLRLTRTLGLEANLTTWLRIYDLLNNIFLKEMFIEKMNAINLVVLRGLSLRILDDFIAAASLQLHVQTFIEAELKMPLWRQDSMVSNKVLQYQLQTQRVGAVMAQVIAESRVVDCYTFLRLQHHLAYQYDGDDRLGVMMQVYVMMRQHFAVPATPEMYVSIIRAICLSNASHQIPWLVFMARAFIHDCTEAWLLPMEHSRYRTLNDDLVEEGPPEGYKIVRRLVGADKLNELEGRYLHQRASLAAGPLTLLRDPLTAVEIEQWDQTKACFATGSVDECVACLVSGPSLHQQAALRAVLPTVLPESNKQSVKYVNVHKNRAINVLFRNRLEKLQNRPDEYVAQRMRQRGLI